MLMLIVHINFHKITFHSCYKQCWLQNIFTTKISRFMVLRSPLSNLEYAGPKVFSRHWVGCPSQLWWTTCQCEQTWGRAHTSHEGEVGTFQVGWCESPQHYCSPYCKGREYHASLILIASLFYYLKNVCPVRQYISRVPYRTKILPSPTYMLNVAVYM